ncbi:MAG: hypothetical protein Q616_SPPC01189G0001, partial [Streptococcus parasanguinis DORA_23_24]
KMAVKVNELYFLFTLKRNSVIIKRVKKRSKNE